LSENLSYARRILLHEVINLELLMQTSKCSFFSFFPFLEPIPCGLLFEHSLPLGLLVNLQALRPTKKAKIHLAGDGTDWQGDVEREIRAFKFCRRRRISSLLTESLTSYGGLCSMELVSERELILLSCLFFNIH